MSVTVRNEEITRVLNSWYVEIRSRHIAKAHRIKEQLDSMVEQLKCEEQESLQDQNLLLYYSLLDFRYHYLIDNMSVSKDSFNKIEMFEKPPEAFLAYYYHFFKAMHMSVIGSYTDAREHFEKAETLLHHIPDEMEKAEFYYKYGSFHFEVQQTLLAIKQVTRAKEIYKQHRGYETNVAFCENLLGLACVYVKEWGLAEEHFTAAMDQFRKMDEDYYMLMVRHNLGWLYASQNLSTLAIRYLSEVVKQSPNHYKAMYVKAKEHFKLEEYELAEGLIERGLQISSELGQEEYQHRNRILKEMNNQASANQLEQVVLAGNHYFEREELYDNAQENYEYLAIRFYKEDEYEKASKYFYLSTCARKKAWEREGLK
ncbi:RapH N-terminal domain-containing protein [Bacillus sp. 196mf]|uniref:response regulator aspartate phosphatase n=1 Tax=Bacillus sp. 196mf TaxID=1761754 RepID=UPI000D7CBF28|nr:RapH N-terminal domain-containing protein [Bacillus sp. 196mf]PYE88569.1 hypothetical protein ATL10_104416 [Bacillus sp. 196mf]